MQSAFAQYQLACVFVFRKKMNKWQRRYAILHKLGLIFKKCMKPCLYNTREESSEGALR